ncbi:hypothetical protein JTB14_031426 [Gonioctena quinquepunctata]|nr:hypothetical protein JTB14_031426 [Gonioctena quinquepunctata]
MRVIILAVSIFSMAVGVPIAQREVHGNYSFSYPVLGESPGVLSWKSHSGPVPHLGARVSDIVIHFYSTSNPKRNIIVDLTNSKALSATSFSPSKPSVFVVHGWTHKFSSASCQDVKNALLKMHDVNVFVVDWNKISRRDYMTAFASVSSIGNILASLISGLVQHNGLNLGITSIVGHSLGGHIAGIAGKVLRGQLAQVIGLDPAGPGFLPLVTYNRITAESAKFVEIIHTGGSAMGYNSPCGHSDYYPNGGLIQRGCELDLTGVCSHYRAYQYLAESIVSGNFKARKCDLYSSFQLGHCNKNQASMMGKYPVDKNAKGIYFLNTRILPPYAKG